MLRHSFESKKAKLKSKNIVEAKEDPRKSCTPVNEGNNSFDSVPAKPSQQSESLKKAVQQLADALAEQKQLRLSLQDKVSQLYSRSITRQRQFQKLLQQTIPFCKKQQKFNAPFASYQKVYQKIIEFFQETNQQAQNQLAATAKELEGIMDRKIRSIAQHMETELAKSRKMLKLNHETITKEIKHIITLSHSILDQNDSFRRKHNDLLLKNQLLRQEKKLLIAETLDKKELIMRLYEQLKDKYDKDDLIENEINLLKKQRRQVEKQYNQYEKQIRSKMDSGDQIRAKSIYAYRADDNFVIASQSKKRPTSKHHTIDTSYSCHSSAKVRNSKSKQESRVITTVEVRNSIEGSRKTFYPNKAQTITTTELFENGREDRKVQELKQILRNQRRKNVQLTKKVNQHLLYQQEMDALLKDIFLHESEESEKRGDQNQTVFRNSGKIYHLVKELGRRLMSSSNPVVNSGYNDLNSLLQQFDDSTNK